MLPTKPQTFENKPVTVLRDATLNDHGFIAGKGANQFVIRLADGTERTVPATDLKDAA